MGPTRGPLRLGLGPANDETDQNIVAGQRAPGWKGSALEAPPSETWCFPSESEGSCMRCYSSWLGIDSRKSLRRRRSGRGAERGETRNSTINDCVIN